MSAVRSSIISTLGDVASNLNLVGNESWTLPAWWPGDNTGKDRVFPDGLTAGRQFYRGMYTAVSFVTLGMACGSYFQSAGSDVIGVAINVDGGDSSAILYNACIATASLGIGAAIVSLFNASPLGLMPSFEGTSPDKVSQKAIAEFVRRDDTIKFTTRGLTRITRHPLILPVVPWGFATAYLAGGRPCDYLLFGGLSIYAMAGCFAQDLRVQREEGSVGTVFQTERGKDGQVKESNEERRRLKSFFDETSFVPFKAVLDGRQSLEDIAKEAPWIQFAVGTAVGVFLEERGLMLLHDWSPGV